MDYYDPRRRALRAVRQLLYPRECPFCGRVLGDVRDCPDCAEQLEALRRKPGTRLVQLAFGGELTVQYGELLPQPVPWAAIGYDLIVPVPASGKKRGYNVPELMALPLAKAMEVPLAPQALERTRAKRHQAGLPLEQRMANVAGAFRAAQPQQLEGKRILLVDDVITTGTTAAACAQALLHAGADSVFALAFATVEFGAPPDDTTPICEDDEEDVYSDF